MRVLLPIVVLVAGLNLTRAGAQDYQLVEPSGVVSAEVYMRPSEMVVDDANGRQYVFQRDRTFDSFDGQYLGFWLSNVNRVVRFPRSGSGFLMVADLDDAHPRYVHSRRRVRPTGSHSGHHNFYGYSILPPYYYSPYGYPVFGYGYQNFGTSLSVGPLGLGAGYRYGRFRRPPMQSMVLDSRVVPRQPLPPVTANLINSAEREIRVTVTDRVAPDQSKRLRIAAGTSQPLTVQRDAGADLVRRVLTFGPDGSQIIREFSTPIEPSPRYELVVHEWRLQSVAIDRTGKSPSVIEDTQFQGRGLGRFVLPPGDQFTGGNLDVVRAALQAGNQGTVAPLLDESDRSQGPLRPITPLEEMILKQRESQGR